MIEYAYTEEASRACNNDLVATEVSIQNRTVLYRSVLRRCLWLTLRLVISVSDGSAVCFRYTLNPRRPSIGIDTNRRRLGVRG